MNVMMILMVVNIIVQILMDHFIVRVMADSLLILMERIALVSRLLKIDLS